MILRMSTIQIVVIICLLPSPFATVSQHLRYCIEFRSIIFLFVENEEEIDEQPNEIDEGNMNPGVADPIGKVDEAKMPHLLQNGSILAVKSYRELKFGIYEG